MYACGHTGNAGKTAVSYTHLDVYKRQERIVRIDASGDKYTTQDIVRAKMTEILKAGGVWNE